MLEIYSCVQLLTDEYQHEGAFCLDIGYIIEMYPDDKYEVEFSDLNGITTAQIIASEEELQTVPPAFDAPMHRKSAEPIKEHNP